MPGRGLAAVAMKLTGRNTEEVYRRYDHRF